MAWKTLVHVAFALALLGGAAVAQEPATLDEDVDLGAAPLETVEEPAATLVGPAWTAPADPEGYPPAPHPFPSHAYNYYYPAPGNDMMPARMYLCPRPVPLWVGYTYITYQGLAPHEFLYKHHRGYYRYHPGSGLTVTKITWR
jgi:hypothetical protein